MRMRLVEVGPNGHRREHEASAHGARYGAATTGANSVKHDAFFHTDKRIKMEFYIARGLALGEPR